VLWRAPPPALCSEDNANNGPLPVSRPVPNFRDLLDFLDAHGGAVTAITTIVYVLLTVLLLLGSRASRQAVTDRAVVLVRPIPSPSGESHMEVVLGNLGPAVATEIEVEFRWADSSGAQRADKEVRQLALPPGRQVHYQPALLVLEPGTALLPSVGRLAEDGLILKLEWSWLNGRRRLGFFERRHHGDLTIDLRDY
jgi:hypothetical protein